MKDQGLAIRLTEPVVFLRGGPNPRRTRRAQGTNNEEADVDAAVDGGADPSASAAAAASHPPSFFPLDQSSSSAAESSRGRERSRDRTPQRAADTGPQEPLSTEQEALYSDSASRNDDVPSVLRGLLTLTLTKPTRIRKIDLKFKGVSRSEWPDGIGPRRIEMSDEIKLVDETLTFFDAAHHAPHTDRPARRARSVGPSSHHQQHQRPGSAPRTRSPSRERGRRTAAGGRSSSVMPARDSSIGPVYGARDTAMMRSQASSANHSRENILPELRNTVSHSSSNEDSDVPRVPITDSPAAGGRGDVPQVAGSSSGSPWPSPRGRPESLAPAPGPSILRLRDSTTELNYPSESSVVHTSAASTRSPSRQASSGLVNELMFDEQHLHRSTVTSHSAGLSPSPSRPPSPGRSGHSLQQRPSLQHSRSSSPDANARHRSITPRAPDKRRTSDQGTHANSSGSSQHHARFSFASIGDALRGKSKSRASSRPGSRRSSITEEDVLMMPAKSSGSRSRSRGRTKGLKALRDALIAGIGEDGHQRDDDEDEEAVYDEDDEHSGDEGGYGAGGHTNKRSSGKDWREFTPGTYTWPILIPVSSQLPPSIFCTWGQTQYRLKAKVRRPGALTANLTAETEVQLVNTPGDDDTEESESIVVDRMWDTQLHYNIAILQKSFAPGGKLPISIRLQPLSKMKLFRLVVCLDEKTTYYAHERSMAKQDHTKHIVLARYQHNEEGVPMLPILSDDAEAIMDHPLKPWFINPTSSDNTTPACLDPFGPWDLETAIPVPNDNRLRFSMTNPQANMAVKHSVRITLRVERGDDQFLDREGRRKRFDIIVEAQVNLLSTATAQTILPAYSSEPPTSSADVHPVPSGSRSHLVSGYDTAAALSLAQAAAASHPPSPLSAPSSSAALNDVLAEQQQGHQPLPSVYESIIETQDFIEGRNAPPTYHYSMAHPETRFEPTTNSSSPDARGRSRSRAR